jgi:hypothetical protein
MRTSQSHTVDIERPDMRRELNISVHWLPGVCHKYVFKYNLTVTHREYRVAEQRLPTPR